MERFSSRPHSAGRRSRTAPPRVVVESVRPQVDGGRYPIKRVLGEEVRVEADVFGDGHDAVACELLFRFAGEKSWRKAPMQFHGNDRWSGSFRVERLGRYEYTVRGWSDPFRTWQLDLEKRWSAGQDLSIELLIGAQLASAEVGEVLRNQSLSDEERLRAARAASSPAPEPHRVSSYDHALEVVVEPVLARFGAWYEMFPRSSRTDGAHGTFRDCIALLPYVAQMGFDVLYFPPIHPIGTTARKGRNNAVAAEPGDVGSPWAIGSEEGGHKAIHPALGSFEDFSLLVSEAKKKNMSVALDIAFQCSPDHPYVREHPEWFRRRPDGTIQYAENPPKKYQDIYPFDFETQAFEALWAELKSVFEFWIGHGVTVFRVDNPHTKPFAFWEWCLGELKREHPEVIFLSEAFTRPRVMHRLAKVGFSQSYTYFTWRNTKQELTDYFSELSQSRSREYFRPNVWPNTPDILHEALQRGARPAFVARAVLAATLAASYGVYGPAYELMEREPRESGSEEYLFSEKYEIKRWERARADSLAPLLQALNGIRRANSALHADWSLRFHEVSNGQLIAYSKRSGDNVILVVVNLDPHWVQSGWLEFAFSESSFLVDDLLAEKTYAWQGGRHYVELNPHVLPAHVFRVRRPLT